MISEKRAMHLNKLAKLKKGSKTSEETKEKIRLGHKRKTDKRILDAGERFCLRCGNKLLRITYKTGIKEGVKKFIERKYCTLYCARHSDQIRKILNNNKTGENNPNWRGGKIIHNGYIYVYSPNHPNKDRHGYVGVHRLVVEKHIGRFLKKKEIVHHIDGNKKNNNISNLMLCKDISQHMKLHKNHAHI